MHNSNRKVGETFLNMAGVTLITIGLTLPVQFLTTSDDALITALKSNIVPIYIILFGIFQVGIRGYIKHETKAFKEEWSDKYNV